MDPADLECQPFKGKLVFGAPKPTLMDLFVANKITVLGRTPTDGKFYFICKLILTR